MTVIPKENPDRDIDRGAKGEGEKTCPIPQIGEIVARKSKRSKRKGKEPPNFCSMARRAPAWQSLMRFGTHGTQFMRRRTQHRIGNCKETKGTRTLRKYLPTCRAEGAGEKPRKARIRKTEPEEWVRGNRPPSVPNPTNKAQKRKHTRQILRGQNYPPSSGPLSSTYSTCWHPSLAACTWGRIVLA
jgi:hypothetical protein